MTSRVLIADDSLTIQKVIGITLASSGYDLVECLNEADLLKKIQSNHFDLVLLDFNLSDSKSGYELAKLIGDNIPDAAIVVMLGTFDTVDESQFESCGISDKIVKPFESSKFIKKCRDLLEEGRPAPSSISKSKSSEEHYSMIDDVDQWRVDAPQFQNNNDVANHVDIVHTDDRSLDPLSSEIEGWGFGPTHSLEEKFQKVFPPVIEEVSDEVNVIERLQSSSQFIQNTHEEKEDLDATEPSFQLPEQLNHNILKTIDDDVSAEAFWAVDEIVPKKSEDENDIKTTHLNEVTADLTDKIEAFKKQQMSLPKIESKFSAKSFDRIETPVETPMAVSSSLNLDEVVEKLKLTLRPMIEDMVKDYCRQNAEKVAWEVIPDLAENLIRKEIKEISESVKH